MTGESNVPRYGRAALTTTLLNGGAPGMARMTRAEAESIALRSINQHYYHPRDSLAVLPKPVIEKPYGWIFFYQSRAFLETGDFTFQLMGNGPVVVRDDGTVHTLGTARSPEEEIAAYEAGQGPEKPLA
jgi:hypothetical protein